jgi:hypothetical protein
VQLEAIAKVRTVAAVRFHRLGVAHAVELRGHVVVAGFAPHGPEQPLGEGENVVAPDERRLNVDLRELRLPVGAQVFITEAAGDLEIAIEAAAHEQLLVDLRRLRQRIELARMHPTGHEVVTRPLRRGLREDGRFQLEIAVVGQIAPRQLQQPVPEHQVLLQLGATQIEIAMPQAQLLGGHFVAAPSGDGKRGRDGRPHDTQTMHPDLDLAGAHVGVHPVGLAGHDLPVAHHDRLHANGGGQCLHFRCAPRRPEGELHQPRAIAQVDEDQTAKVATPMYPPAQANGAAHIAAPKQAAGVGAHGRGEHGRRNRRRHRGRYSASRSEGCMRDTRASRRRRTERKR